jgi:molybdate transport system substrate-binding protein
MGHRIETNKNFEYEWKLIRGFMLFVFTFSLLLHSLGSHAAEVSVFAAASLTESLQTIAAQYQRETGDKPVFNFGASSFLERQIEEGAPADIFFSADEAKMDALQQKGLILKETRTSLLSNSLVIVIASDSTLTIHSPNDLAGSEIKRLALADPKTVPAGIYARKYLTKLKLWALIEAKVVPTDNVRAALAAVESGNVEAGMVYKTDAAISKKVKIAYEVQDNPDISYSVAVVKDSKEPAAARKFLQYLCSETARKIFERYGFIVKRPAVSLPR